MAEMIKVKKHKRELTKPPLRVLLIMVPSGHIIRPSQQQVLQKQARIAHLKRVRKRLFGENS